MRVITGVRYIAAYICAVACLFPRCDGWTGSSSPQFYIMNRIALRLIKRNR